jgi:hypothetical protein
MAPWQCFLAAFANDNGNAKSILFVISRIYIGTRNISVNAFSFAFTISDLHQF